MKTLFFIVSMGIGICLTCDAQLVDNGDETVTDAISGLIWLKNSLPPTGGQVGLKSWQEAMTWAESLVFAGYDDWRLPSALEFEVGTPDLVWNSTNNEWGNLYGNVWGNPANQAQISPMEYYPCCNYWTSTENPGNKAEAASFFISYDGLWLNQFYTKTTLMRYTAVRGSAPPNIAPECNDGYDNDGDGKIDYPDDESCSSSDDSMESGRICFKLPFSGITICLYLRKVLLIFSSVIIVGVAFFYILKRRNRNVIR